MNEIILCITAAIFSVLGAWLGWIFGKAAGYGQAVRMYGRAAAGHGK